MSINHLLLDVVPSVPSVRHRLGDALREVQLLRRLLRLSELAEEYRLKDCNGDACHTVEIGLVGPRVHLE